MTIERNYILLYELASTILQIYLYITLSSTLLRKTHFLHHVFVHFLQHYFNKLSIMTCLNDAVSYNQSLDSDDLILVPNLFEKAPYQFFLFCGLFIVRVVDVDIDFLRNHIGEAYVNVDMIILPILLSKITLCQINNSLRMTHLVSFIHPALFKRLLKLRCGGE